MSTNYTQVTGLLGVNLEGNEAASTENGVPRVPVLTPVMISGNRTAVYVIAGAALNPATTVAFHTRGGGSGTVAGTTGSATTGTTEPYQNHYFVTLNIATTATGEYIWARTEDSIGL